MRFRHRNTHRVWSNTRFSQEIYRIVSQKVLPEGGSGGDKPGPNGQPIDLKSTVPDHPGGKQCCK
eukprot:TCALIF_09620-PC protein Name:"Protein of unknown function" AED:0.14 eAED:0.14 QI:390/1/1/1/0/0.33/3/2549/64